MLLTIIACVLATQVVFFPIKSLISSVIYFCALKKMFYWGKNTWYETYTLNKSLTAQYRVVNYRYNVVHQIPRMYSACLTETLCLLISNPYFTLPPSLVTTVPFFDSLYLTILTTSCKWNHAIFFLFMTGLFNLMSSKFIHVVTYYKI